MSIQVDKFIVCDDIREEKTKKLLIIGMYPENKIRINQNFPYVHPHLSFFITFSTDKEFENIRLKVVDSENKTVIESPFLKGAGIVKEGQLLISVHNVHFNVQGEYKVIIDTDAESTQANSFSIMCEDNIKNKQTS